MVNTFWGLLSAHIVDHDAGKVQIFGLAETRGEVCLYSTHVDILPVSYGSIAVRFFF